MRLLTRIRKFYEQMQNHKLNREYIGRDKFGNKYYQYYSFLGLPTRRVGTSRANQRSFAERCQIQCCIFGVENLMRFAPGHPAALLLLRYLPCITSVFWCDCVAAPLPVYAAWKLTKS